MFVEQVQNNGRQYLRLVQSVRVTNRNGYKVSQKKVILNLGPLERYDDGMPDYIGRLRQSFKDGKPLIPELLPYVGEQEPGQYKVIFRAGDEHCFGRPGRLAPCILDPVFSALGLDELLANVKHNSGIQYDLQGIVRLLAYGRILDPASKIATMPEYEVLPAAGEKQ